MSKSGKKLASSAEVEVLPGQDTIKKKKSDADLKTFNKTEP
jgi:hypothetical protein